MKTALSITLKVLGGCVALVVGLYGILVLINLADEDLTVEARQFIEDPSPPAPTIPESQNAFYAFLGFTAEADKDPRAVGQAIVETFHREVEANPSAKWDWDGLRETTLYKTNRIRFSGKSDALCTRDTSSCLAHAASDSAAIGQLISKNAILVSRYRTLSSFTAYENPFLLTITTPVSINLDATRTADLLRTELALKAGQGKADQSFEALLDDLAFWRRMLPGKRQLLIERMLVLSQLEANLRLISEMVRHYGVPKKLDAQVAVALRPLKDHERDLASVFRTEGTSVSSMRDRSILLSEEFKKPGGLIRAGAYLLMPLYQPNATFNSYAHAWAFQMEIVQVPSTEFLIRRAAHERRYQEEFAHVGDHWYDWYNPIGKLFFAIGSPGSFARFPARMHDLDGLLRLVALQAQIKQRRIPDGKIGEFVAATGPPYQDPYTGQPMRWDPKRRTLSFDGYSGGYGGGEKTLFEVRL